MKTRYHYLPGTVRWRRFDGDGDVRGYRPAAGWQARAELLDDHPVTGRPFSNAPQWWIRECLKGDADDSNV